MEVFLIMPNIISDNIFQNFCKLSQKVQKLEGQVQEETVTQKKRVQMHKELESLQKTMHTLRDNAAHAQRGARQLFSQIEEMESQIISLCRKVEERFEDFEISLISKEAIDLSQSLTTGKMEEIASQVHELRHNVLFLFKHRRPSLQHRKIIHLALKLTDYADEILQTSKAASKVHLQLILHLKMLLMQAVFQTDTFVDPEEAELAMELYEIADLVHHKREKEGYVRLNLIRCRLTSGQRARLDAAMNVPKEMMKILLEIADGDPCSEWEEKKPAVIHVLQA